MHGIESVIATVRVQGTVITHVCIGMGPCGEMRYPSYPQRVWRYPGIGAFQCFSPAARADFDRYCERTGEAAGQSRCTHLRSTKPRCRPSLKPPLAEMPLPAQESYNETPASSKYFERCVPAPAAAIATEFAQLQSACCRTASQSSRKAFLDWYSSCLQRHADEVLQRCTQLFRGSTPSVVTVVVKVPGIHWWSEASGRPAEACAGLAVETGGFGVYQSVCAMLASHGAALSFTCTEMPIEGTEHGNGFHLVQRMAVECARARIRE
jgi:beta-amylase